MQNVLLIAVIAALALAAGFTALRRLRRGSACCGEREAAPKRVGVTDRNKAHYPCTVEMQISGMTCENCARRVENALNGQDGIWASVRIDTHKAVVRCKTAPDEAALRDVVRQAGYVVSSFQILAK